MVKVSIILPVYSVAEYIEKCTRSLLAQTLQDMEFIFVDDHGPDNSIELARQVIAGHPREDQFRFLRPEHNLGAGMARNYGMDAAQGEYIGFVDSDDWIEPDMFESLYNEARRSNCDLCCCQMQKVYPDGSRGELLENPYVDGNKLTHARRAHILSNYLSLFASMIYRREMIEQHAIRFPEDRSADDSYFVGCAWMMAQSVGYVKKPLYNYLIRPCSVTTTKDSTKYQKRMKVFEKLVQYAKEHGVYDEFQNEIDFMYTRKGYLSSAINYVINSTEPKPSTLRDIAAQSSLVTPQYRNSTYVRHSLPIQGLDWLIRHCPSLAIPVLRVYAKQKNIVS
ncbi:MAG: glycosyltransferase [Bacteroidales bacterium]|nr:glycosyltransferase [Bacteroidales bacterium]